LISSRKSCHQNTIPSSQIWNSPLLLGKSVLSVVTPLLPDSHNLRSNTYYTYFQALKECFEKQDIPLLQQIIAKMEPTEAKYHMKRCVDSGLWVPEANKEEQATSNEPSFISS